ncbi:hypothetical protein HDA40_007686 [Hamadaea flava]|nr:hypothetical protein [Hamadaea flava]
MTDGRRRDAGYIPPPPAGAQVPDVYSAAISLALRARL